MSTPMDPRVDDGSMLPSEMRLPAHGRSRQCGRVRACNVITAAAHRACRERVYRVHCAHEAYTRRYSGASAASPGL